MTKYEFNVANYKGLPTMTKEELDKSIPYIVSFLDHHKSKYYLFLSYQQRYYTIFAFPNGNYNPEELARQVNDLASDIGDVKSIEVSSLDNMLEFWIVDKEGNCDVFCLFDYEKGVIEIP